MGAQTSIEWTRGDDGTPGATWNPVTGCVEVSPGCNLCYAKTFAERWRGTPGHYYEHGFDVQLRPDKLELPLRWRRPRRIFVNSMSDLFHDQVPDDYIARVFAVMALAPRHTFQVLTKRHGRMRALLSRSEFHTAVAEHMLARTTTDQLEDVGDVLPLPNVWLGVSAENQQWADIRIPALLATPAAVHWISAEPLLGPIDLFGDPGAETPGPGIIRNTVHWFSPDYGDQYDYDDQVGLDWVVVGGESGRGARPMHPDWARSLRDQCKTAGVPFLFKQWGVWVPESMWLHGANAPAAFLSTDGRVRPLVNGKPTTPPMARGDDITMRLINKKIAGRTLDGREWSEYPQVVTGKRDA